MQDFRQGNMVNPTAIMQEFHRGDAGIALPFMIRPQDWVNNEILLDNMFPSTEFDIDIMIPQTATEEQKKAYAECHLEGSKISNSIKIGKDGKLPEIDIPILLLLKKSQLAKIQENIMNDNRIKSENESMRAKEEQLMKSVGRTSILNPGIPNESGIVLPFPNRK